MLAPQIVRAGIRYLHSILLVLALLGNADRIDAQRPTTDPRERDADHDGYPDGPDHWLVLPDGEGGTVTYLVRGEDFNGNGKYEPLGDDSVEGTIDDESDPNDPRSHPIRPARELDSDRDGLPDAVEFQIGTDPFDRDSDDDGLIDGDEYYGIGRCYVQGRRYRTSPMHADSDMDWLPDGVELGVFGEDPTFLEGYDVGSTDRDCSYTYFDDQGVRRTRSCYTPDADEGFAGSFTDPFVKDTNGNGRRDGQDDRNLNGRFDLLGEDGVPSDDDETDPAVGIWLGGANKANYFPFDGIMDVFFEGAGIGDSRRVDKDSRRQRLRFHWGSSGPENITLTLRRLDGSEPTDLVFAGNGDTSLNVSATPERVIDFEVVAGDSGSTNGRVRVAWATAGTAASATSSSSPGTSPSKLYIPVTRLAWNRLIGNYEGNRVKVELSDEESRDIMKALDLAFGFDTTLKPNFTSLDRAQLESWSINKGHGGLPARTINDFYASFGIEFYVGVSEADRSVQGVENLLSDFYVLNAPDLRAMILEPDGVWRTFTGNRYHFSEMMGVPFAEYLAPPGSPDPRSCDALNRFREYASTFWHEPEALNMNHDFPHPNVPSPPPSRFNLFDEAARRREFKAWQQIEEGNRDPRAAMSLDIYVFPYFSPDVFASTGPSKFTVPFTMGTWDPDQSGRMLPLELWNRNVYIHSGTFYEGASDAAIMPELTIRPYPSTTFTNALTHEIAHYLGLRYHTLYTHMRDLSSYGINEFNLIGPPSYGYMPDSWYDSNYNMTLPVRTQTQTEALIMRLDDFLATNPALRGNACLPKARHFGFQDEVGQLMSPFDMYCDWVDSFDPDGSPRPLSGMTQAPVVRLAPPRPLEVQWFDRDALTIQQRYYSAAFK